MFQMHYVPVKQLRSRGVVAHSRTVDTTFKMSVPRLCLLCAVLCINNSVASVQDVPVPVRDEPVKRIQLLDGVRVTIPANNTRRILSFEIDTNRSMGEERGKKNKLLERILPLFIMPFLLQSAIVPLFLSMLKFMLFKSLMVGKLALTLIIFNAFKNHNVVKGRDAMMADAHYGYHGNEYGAYIN
ncbi:unnamed protein product [Chilo suppressalis]|uniref:Uncharacterized protein n=1 Tax=Chilo suppressalis TaxID=168631 RepID=A0ABN8LC95_CHISP|nr:unnamed protein product [Chilo suppressalis]